jgi:hypothetical protein
VARLAAREEPVDFDQASPIPLALVGQHGQQHPPAGIADDARQAAVFHHAGNVQVFDHDHLIFANESGAELVHGVLPAVADESVQAGEFQACLESVLGSFLFAGESLELDSEEARDEALRLARSEADELIHIKTRLLGVIPGGKQENSMETFTCEMCGGTFEKGCSDDEANAEAKANFGVDNASTHEGMATVCDPCYEKLMGPA